MDDEEVKSLVESNVRTIEMMENHCSHARVEVSLSPLGRMLQVPLGPAEISCQYSAYGGSSSVNIRWVALDFYENSCIGCPHRNPNGRLPTIATEFEAGQRANEAARQSAAAHVAERHAAWQNRKMRRDAAVANKEYPVRDLAAHIAALDVEPGRESAGSVDQARQRILEVARLSPQLFLPELIDSLLAVAAEQDAAALEATLALVQAGKIPNSTATVLAVQILATNVLAEAAEIITNDGSSLSEEHAQQILRSAIWLASEPDPFPHSLKRRPARPALLKLLADNFWQLTYKAVVAALNQDEPSYREAGADAAKFLIRDNPIRFDELNGALINAITGKDRGYGGDPAPDSAVIKALAQSLALRPWETIDQIEAHGEHLSDRVRELLTRVPIEAFRDAKHLPPEVENAAVTFLIRRLNGGWGDDAASAASHELKYLSKYGPVTLVGSIDALLAELIRQPDPVKSALELPDEPDALARLEERASVEQRRYVRRDISEMVGNIARRSPHEVLERLFLLLDATAGDEPANIAIKSTLIDALTHAVTDETLAAILPRLYTYLLSDNQVVRSAAVVLWKACARVGNTLPTDLSELAKPLLEDPYVIVHGAMVENLSGLRVAEEKLPALFGPVLNIVATHSNSLDFPLPDALLCLLWLGERLTQEEKTTAAAAAIKLSSALRFHDRKRILLDHHLRAFRKTKAWGVSTLQLLLESDKQGFEISPRHDDILEALLSVPVSLSDAPFTIFYEIARGPFPKSLHRIYEMVELLQSADRWADAYELARKLLSEMPATLDFQDRRSSLEVIAKAAAVELTVFERRYRVSDAEFEVKGDAWFMTHLVARSKARAAVSEIPLGNPQQASTDLFEAADMIEKTIGGDTRTSLYVDVLRTAALFAAYDSALRTGASDAASRLASANRNGEVLAKKAGILRRSDRIVAFANAAAASTGKDVDLLLRSMSEIALALPLSDSALGTWRRSKNEAPPRSVKVDTHPDDLVVVCGVELNGYPVYDVQVLLDRQIHDVMVEVKMQQWPSWADFCEVRLLSVLAASALEPPVLLLRKNDLVSIENGFAVSQTGQLVFRADRPAGSPPLDLPLQVRFMAEGGRTMTALIAGHERLQLRPYDPSRDVMTSHHQMDQALLAFFAPLYDDPNLDDADVKAFCRFFTACVTAAQATMFDKTFRAKSKVTETQFHDKFEAKLLALPDLEGRLTRRDAVAGGWDDLLHDGIIAELKVEKTRPRSVSDCAQFIGQPTQYGVGLGSRLSILVVFDHTQKNLPPSVLENHIGWLIPQQHGHVDPRYPSRVGVLVINTNWTVPSAWSRKKVPVKGQEPN